MLSPSRYTTLRWATSGIKSIRSLRSVKSFSFSATRSQLANLPPWHNRSLSRFWIPTGGFTSSDSKQGDPTALLVRAGYIRQSQSGIFHYLPLAHRVEERLKNRLSWYLEDCLGASSLSLSALSSETLWRQSGRIGASALSTVQDHQFLTVNDRKHSQLILSPTHEEEITTIVAKNTRSYHDFPLRLYQINRKYRDELRPRHGLLRTKEFTMKDLYTFDIDEKAAIQTYDQVRDTYQKFFRWLGLEVVEAKASSGDMGGELSHEFHILSENGEDTLHVCSSCGFAENEEVALKPADCPIEQHRCPQCSKMSMIARSAVEIGHTFHLGTRYSEPLEAVVEVPDAGVASTSAAEDGQAVRKTKRVPLQMGCHGIGLSRLVGAIASIYADSKGLRWPLNVHPMSAVIIINGPAETVPGLADIFNALNSMGSSSSTSVRFNIWVDDRNRSLSWKLKDAELIGYPITVVLGGKWLQTGEYEIRCRFKPELSRNSKDLCGSVAEIIEALHPEGPGLKESMFLSKTTRKHVLMAANKHPTYVPRDNEVNEGARPSHMLEQQTGVSTPRKRTYKSGSSPSRMLEQQRGESIPRVRTSKSVNSPSPGEGLDLDAEGSNPPTCWQPASERNKYHLAANSKLSPNNSASPSAENAPKHIPVDNQGELGTTTLSREQLLEKVQLLQRLCAIQNSGNVHR